MIEFLNSLATSLKQDLWLIETMFFNPLFEKHSYKSKELRYSVFGKKVLMQRKLDNLIHKMENIRSYCQSAINGTFYEDHLKQWEGTDAEGDYTENTPYNYILMAWEMYPTPILGTDIKEWIEENAQLSTAMNQTIEKFCPEAGPYKQNEKGEMEKVSVLDCQIDDNLNAGATLVNVDVANKRIELIKQIAEQKGSLEEILNLVM